MRLFDTHAHFPLEDSKVLEKLTRAKSAGVVGLTAVGGNDELNAAARRAATLARANPLLCPRVFVACGFDRDCAADWAFQPFETADCAAIGEIGLDYHYSPETRRAQIKLFESQVRLSLERNLPIVIHTREADEDTLAILQGSGARGIIHCYTGGPAVADKLLEFGFYISFSGILTFRSAEIVRESARIVPNERLLIETDSPYLAPVPYRGKENEPAYVIETARYLSDMRGMPVDDLAELTTRNACRIFAVEV